MPAISTTAPPAVARYVASAIMASVLLLYGGSSATPVQFTVTKQTPTVASRALSMFKVLSTSGSAVSIDGFANLSASGAIASRLLPSCTGLQTTSTGMIICSSAGAGISQTAGDARYVNTSGDTMTGALTVNAAISGSTVFGKKCPAEYAIQYTASGTALAVNSGTTLSVPIAYTLSGYSLARFTANVDQAGTTGLTRFALRNQSKGKRQMFTTNPSIDTAETSTRTAATAYTINASNDDVSGGDNLSFDILQIQTGVAPKGLKVYLEFSCP